LFGEIVNEKMILNDFGKIVQSTWIDLPNHVPNIELDAFVIMPNHIHGIIIIVGAGSKPAPKNENPPDKNANTSNKNENQSNKIIGTIGYIGTNLRAGLEPAPTGKEEPAPTGKKISEIVRQLKTFSARQINQLRNVPGFPVWQRDYYEHIVRNDDALDRIRTYITNNPLHWPKDKDYFETEMVLVAQGIP
jgi:REP element-mobilizing transposase RayT